MIYPIYLVRPPLPPGYHYVKRPLSEVLPELLPFVGCVLAILLVGFYAMMTIGIWLFEEPRRTLLEVLKSQWQWAKGIRLW